MSSLFRQQASRNNGSKSRGPVTEEGKRISALNSQQSTGPRTPEGKSRSSLNALDHGLLAKSILLPEENHEVFLQHLGKISEVHRPTDYIETLIVQKIAIAEWYRLRVWCVEMAIIARATRDQQTSSDHVTDEMTEDIPAMHTSMAMKTLCDSSGYLELLRRYAIGHSREAKRASDELHQHRERKRLERRRAQKQKVFLRNEVNLTQEKYRATTAARGRPRSRKNSHQPH